MGTEATDWLVYFLLVHGLVYLVTTSSIGTVPRILICKLTNWAATLLYCPMCVGFWVGVGVAPLAPLAPSPALWQALLMDRVLSGVVAMGFMALIDRIWPYMGPTRAFEVERPVWEKTTHAAP